MNSVDELIAELCHPSRPIAYAHKDKLALAAMCRLCMEQRNTWVKGHPLATYRAISEMDAALIADAQGVGK